MKTDNDNMFMLQKLSRRNDFENIHNKYFYRKELSIIRNSLEQKYSHTIWMNIHRNRARTVNEFYISLISDIYEEVRNVMLNKANLINVEKVLDTVRNYMIENIAEISNRLFVTEINKADIEEDIYIKKLSNKYETFEELTNKYPYWSCLLKYFLQDSRRFLLEFFSRLMNEHEEVAQEFFGEIVRIENIVLCKGDRHNGKFVIEIETPKGNYFYKPRSANGDEAFKKCLDKISENENVLDMKISEFVNKGGYSWFKKVEYALFQNESEKQRYYRRLGQLIAAIYILNGNDIHHENLISSGEYPTIIDIETILTSRLLFMKKTMPEYTRKKENFYILDSVRNSMIIPNVLKYKEHNLDLSPLQIVSKRQMIDLDKNKNHKVFEDEVAVITEIICQGFEAVYKEVENHKNKYEKYFKECFKGVRVRFLNKPTSEYSNIKNLLYNPVCLYDSNFAFAVTSRLFNKNAVEIPYEELVEQKEVLLLNIPYFEVESDGKDLILYNDCVIKGYFVESPLDGVTNKLDVLGEKDYIRQKTIIEKSFEVISSDFVVRELSEAKSIEHTVENSPVKENIELFLDSSIKKVFDRGLVHPFSEQFFWVDPMLQGDNETGEELYQICDIPNSYYGGNIGILTALLSLNNKKKYGEQIKKLIVDINKDIKKMLLYNQNEINIGAYNGIAAYIRYYINLYRYAQITKEQLREYSQPIIVQIENSYLSDNKLDILDGSAGVILTLVELYNILPKESNKLLNLIRKIREHIIEKIVYKDEEAYFPLENRSDIYYSGFAHGSSGIIMALNKANKLLGLEERVFINRLLCTERKMYDPKRKIWNRDNRKMDYSWGWCHGIPGIMLSRIELYKDGYKDERILEEMQELYDISLSKSLGSNLTLCHGDLSNIVICKYAGEVLGKDNHIIDDYVEEILPHILDSVNKRIRGTEAVGLMNGIMGIVMFVDNYIMNGNDSEIKRVLTSI